MGCTQTIAGYPNPDGAWYLTSASSTEPSVGPSSTNQNSTDLAAAQVSKLRFNMFAYCRQIDWQVQSLRGQITTLNAELAATKTRLDEGLADVQSAVEALNDNVAAGRTSSDVVPAKLDAVVAAIEAGDPAAQTVELSAVDRELATDGQTGLYRALWLIAGLLVGLFAAGRIWDVLRP